MSYTTSHPFNFPSTSPCTLPLAHFSGGASVRAVASTAPPEPSSMQSRSPPAGPSPSPQQLQNRRQIVPLMGMSASGSDAVVPQPSTGTPKTAPRKASYTANLEAQVRVLEQEVHLLRTGLEQNEKLRHASATAAPPPRRSSSTKRVHFGPSSVVVLPQPARSTSASSSAGTEVEGRPRLAFGQRVNETRSRISAHGPPPTNPSQSHRMASRSRPIRTSVRSGSVPSSSPAPDIPTTSVNLSPAPASLRGGNKSGIPLQGTAEGGTLVAADTQPPAASLAGPSSTTPAAAATVWASTDPSLLWPRAAAAAIDTFPGASDLSRYPFRSMTTSSPAAAPTPVILEAPVADSAQVVSAAASPILVAMSSDGPPLTSLTQPATPATGPATEVTVSPAAVPATSPAAPPPASDTALTVAHPLSHATALRPSVSATAAPTGTSILPAASSSAAGPATVAQLETEVLSLRDTLAQREALLHRVLLELHDRDSHVEARSQSLPASGEAPQQSRQAMRLLAEELFAVQTQLSHARISHQLVLSELHACRSKAYQASPPQQAAAPEKTPSGTSPFSSGPLQEQLDVALKKLKAWEDWYAASAIDAEVEGAAVTAGNSNVISSAKVESSSLQQPPSKAGNTEKLTRAATPTNGPHKRKGDSVKEKSTHKTAAPCWCPHCGFALSATPSGLSKSGSGVVPLGFGLPGLAPAPVTSNWPAYYTSLSNPSVPETPGPPAAAPSAPYVSAYALDSAMLHHLTSQCAGNGIGDHGSAEVPSGAANKVSGGAATPPPPPPETASSPSALTQANEVQGKSRSAHVSENAQTATTYQNSGTGACGASPMWAVPLSGASIAGMGAVNGGARERTMKTAFMGGRGSSDPYLSPYCDRLDHAQQQAYRAQRYVTQLAREAAVRELAEAERQVVEQRLSFWRHHHPSSPGLSVVSPGTSSLAPCTSTPDGPHSADVGKQEVVE
ncbi:hypothetical protein, unknown function [Leishmania tarentolae]|uniref:Uncharacterized protein n=1 Tax=Leishmania tarentolae TaxID=5689 RepID=A0A640KE85_LEITA|nr:hypothetical protein, unknown function [Leishmania tarentolae]